VTRPLHSVSRMCDEGCEVMFTKTEAIVKKNGKVVSRYPRKGGLYVRSVKIRAGSNSRPKGFTRPSPKR